MSKFFCIFFQKKFFLDFYLCMSIIFATFARHLSQMVENDTLFILYMRAYMTYRFTFMNDEVDSFKLVFEADADATFLDFHKAILAAVGYPDDQMTSFFLCNAQWEKEQEVTLVEMDNSMEYDNMTMEATLLSDLLTEAKQRLIYVFDPMMERYFFGSLTSIEPGHTDGVVLVEKKGHAPKQLKEDDILNVAPVTTADLAFGDDDFYGDSQYDLEDLDDEGFQSLSFEDGSMF